MGWQEECARLRSLSGVKWSSHAADVIPAWVADMDLPSAPPVTEALGALVARGDFGYNFCAAKQLPGVFAERQERRYGWRPDVERIRLFCDVLQAIDTVLWLHTSPGDGVVLLTPVYPPFYRAVEQARCRVVDVPLDRAGWRIDADALRSAIDPGTRVMLLCNPHNPTGRAFSREELGVIAEVAGDHDLLVISDEIWADLTYPPARHIPFASLSAETSARTVTVTAASKAFSLAGLRCAIAHVGHTRTFEQLGALPGHLLGAVGSPGAEATLAAWTQGDEWLAATLGQLARNRDHLAERLAAELPSVGFTRPEATYLAWLDFSATGLGEDPAAAILAGAKVALSSGGDFGSAGSGWARLNFGTTPAILDEAIDRIAVFVRERVC